MAVPACSPDPSVPRTEWGVGALFLISVLILLAPGELFAFGPLTHLRFAEWVIRERWLFPATIRELLSLYPVAYLYGSILADFILGKGFFVEKEEHSHDWGCGFQLYRKATTPEEASFALGYLSHLAADTVAHNSYVPVYLVLSRGRLGRGHLYWEILYDRYALPPHLRRLKMLLSLPSQRQLRHFLSSHLKETLFSHPLNQVFFRAQMQIHRRYQRFFIAHRLRTGNTPLPLRVVEHYDAMALQAISDLFLNGEKAGVLALDPRGEESMERAKRLIGQTRRESFPLTFAEARERFFPSVPLGPSRPLPFTTLVREVPASPTP